jgi:RNA polymerase sigma factor (sigma-70 family)
MPSPAIRFFAPVRLNLPPEDPAASPPPPPARDFGSFYRTTVEPLRAYLAKLLGDRTEAQDVAQNAFVRIRSVVDGGHAREPRLLLFATARRLALNEIRRRRNQRLEADGAGAIEMKLSDAPSVEQIVAARQEIARFEEILLRLPPGCRQVFLLRKVEDLTHDEIARRLGISTKTVENHMTRAYRLLREAYSVAEAAAPHQHTQI